jgi:hypothetical protein
LEHLVQLGAGYNLVQFVDGMSSSFPQLRVLDLTHNNIEDMEQALLAFTQLTELRALYLERNPVCLLKLYRPMVASALVRLSRLDGLPIDPSERILEYKDNLRRKAVAIWLSRSKDSFSKTLEQKAVSKLDTAMEAYVQRLRGTKSEYFVLKIQAVFRLYALAHTRRHAQVHARSPCV